MLSRFFIGALSFAILLILLTTPAIASQTTKNEFSHEQLEGLSGYKYDKFDKTWYYESEFKVNDTNMNIWLLFRLQGTESTITVPTLFFVVDKNGETLIIDDVKILIDDTVYSFSNLTESTTSNYSYIYIGTIGKSMLDDLAASDNASFKLYHNGYNTSFDIKDFKDSFKYIITWANTLDSLNLWEKIPSQTMATCDSDYSANIS